MVLFRALSQITLGQLTVLGRPHGSCIDVHVRVYFNGSDLQPSHLQQETSGRRYMQEFKLGVAKVNL